MKVFESIKSGLHEKKTLSKLKFAVSLNLKVKTKSFIRV